MPPGPRRHARPPGGRRLLSWLDLRAAPYFFISPYFLLFAIFGIFPLIFTAWVSLHDWQLAGDKTFIGLENYTELLADEKFWNAVVNTVGIFVIATVPQLVLALLLANALNKRLRGRLVLRLGILAAADHLGGRRRRRLHPAVRPRLRHGQLDARRSSASTPIHWQNAKWSSWIAIATMVDWRWTGYNAIIYLAAMQTIPKDLYEAAAIDGASPAGSSGRSRSRCCEPHDHLHRHRLDDRRHHPVRRAGDVRRRPMTGGTTGQFQTVAMFIVKEGFRDFEYGYAAAAAWILFLLILIAALINFLIVRGLGRSR